MSIASERLMTLDEASRVMPSIVAGLTVSERTLLSWGQRGLGGVKLETIRVGVRVATSEEAIRRFFAAVNGQEDKTFTAEDAETRRKARGRGGGSGSGERRKKRTEGDVGRVIGRLEELGVGKSRKSSPQRR